MRTRVHLTWAAVFVIALVSTGEALAAATRTSSIDSKLVGTWTHTVTRADVTREEATPSLVGSLCTLTVKSSGVAHIACPHTPGAVFTGKLIPTGTNRIQILFADDYPNTYRWALAGRKLTLTKLKDPTSDRAATMAGVWTRR